MLCSLLHGSGSAAIRGGSPRGVGYRGPLVESQTLRWYEKRGLLRGVGYRGPLVERARA